MYALCEATNTKTFIQKQSKATAHFTWSKSPPALPTRDVLRHVINVGTILLYSLRSLSAHPTPREGVFFLQSSLTPLFHRNSYFLSTGAARIALLPNLAVLSRGCAAALSSPRARPPGAPAQPPGATCPQRRCPESSNNISKRSALAGLQAAMKQLDLARKEARCSFPTILQSDWSSARRACYPWQCIWRHRKGFGWTLGPSEGHQVTKWTLVWAE